MLSSTICTCIYMHAIARTLAIDWCRLRYYTITNSTLFVYDRDLRARPDLLAQQENEEIAEKLDLRAWRDLLVLEASLAHLAFKARRETLVQQDRREPRVTAVLVVSRVCPVPLVLLVTRVFLALLVPLVHPASLAPRVRLDATEVLVSKVSWVPPVPAVLLAKTAPQVPQVLLVLLVRLVLLVSPWATTQ